MWYTDIDECHTGIDLCEYNCTNTIGSYKCSCDIGFQLNEDGLQCDGQIVLTVLHMYPLIIVFTFYFLFFTDVDECYERIDGCQQECVNTNGSYVCACRTGYRLTSDRYSCTGISYLVLNFVRLVPKPIPSFQCCLLKF